MNIKQLSQAYKKNSFLPFFSMLFQYLMGNSECVAKLSQFSDDFIQKKLSRDFQKLLISYYSTQYNNSATKDASEGLDIFVFWGNGFRNLPPVVNLCVSSIQKYSGKHHVIFLDLANFQEYITVSQVIYTKLKNGIIDLQQFSDILRVKLLAKYGGFWIDATVFITSEIVNALPISTIKYVDDSSRYNMNKIGNVVSFGAYYLVASFPQHPLFCFLSDFYDEYWEKYNRSMSYFLLDHAVILARRELSRVSRDLEVIPCLPKEQSPYSLLASLQMEGRLSGKISVSQFGVNKLTHKIKFNADALAYLEILNRKQT